MKGKNPPQESETQTEIIPPYRDIMASLKEVNNELVRDLIEELHIISSIVHITGKI
ncbi:hypothetical protein [Paenibacillus polymyxa]|uniref:hypothetical protein n=1 Tax=Paenibacillus polymyxa TaxID=1406 RepID=UPI00287FDD41|nr:hypothetical protein [Paenibacillus polymyxa]